MNASLSYDQLKQAATNYGTPLYVYHAEKIAQQYQDLFNHFDTKTTRIFYACKALTNIHILDVVKRACLLYTSPSPRDRSVSRMPSSA